MDLRALIVLDSLQPQLTGFLQTVSQGFMPLEHNAVLFVEIQPGISINRLTDVVVKRTSVQPVMQIVERAFGLLVVHHEEIGQIHAAQEAVLDDISMSKDDRMVPSIISSDVITSVDGRHAQLINRMRHGDLFTQGQTLYLLEVKPAAYAALAANTAEKTAEIGVLEVQTFGSVGRLWLSGNEENIAVVAKTICDELSLITGRST